MIRMHLANAAHALNAQHSGADVEFHGVSTDTRSLQAHNLFVALAGPNFDAHHFVAQAYSKGAAAALLSQPLETALPTLRVPDTRLALGSLAHAWRQQFSLPLVAVTGSNGKTTVKEMIASILQQMGPVLTTLGNLNNDIGLPLTLLQLDAAHRFAVIEMGANHGGEIAYLTQLARPTVALITNAGAAHLEGFGSLEGVARAKGEIFAGLAEQGCAVLNHDDPYAALWATLLGTHRSLRFGLTPGADVSAAWQPRAAGSLVQLHTPDGDVDIDLKLLGRHNVMNALAASAAALAVGAQLTHIKHGLEAMHPVKGRLQIKSGARGTVIIDDTYNANPSSLQAALEVLAAYPGAKWLVLGDMGELGASTQALHEQAGHYARAAHIDRLFTVGALSQLAQRSYGVDGGYFATQEELIAALQAALADDAAGNVTLLVKGSRSAHMEHVVAALSAC